MAYKKLIKVSNVCQLMDKSKYPATQTNSGITFTNNGDGTITANGTSTGNAQFLVRQRIHCKDNHKYLVKGSPSGGGYNVYRLTTSVYGDGSYVTGFSDSGSGNISDALLGSYTITVFIDIYKGVTVSNLTFKPQLFDLTEMYGAGNEPTTVEQFRQDFPDEMYDYSPYCWLTSYKRVFMTGGGNYLTSYQRNLTCKTKNLFDISKVRSADIINGSILEMGSNYFIVQGNISASPGTASYANGWFRPLHNYNSPNNLYLKAGDIITISADYTVLEDNSLPGSKANIYLYGAKNLAKDMSAFPTVGVKTRISTTYTIPDGGDGYYYPVFTLNSSKIRIENIQLELGDTATDYVPYGHL